MNTSTKQILFDGLHRLVVCVVASAASFVVLEFAAVRTGWQSSKFGSMEPDSRATYLSLTLQLGVGLLAVGLFLRRGLWLHAALSSAIATWLLAMKHPHPVLWRYSNGVEAYYSLLILLGALLGGLGAAQLLRRGVRVISRSRDAADAG